jgi:hypothetical protein
MSRNGDIGTILQVIDGKLTELGSLPYTHSTPGNGCRHGASAKPNSPANENGFIATFCSFLAESNELV